MEFIKPEEAYCKFTSKFNLSDMIAEFNNNLLTKDGIMYTSSISGFIPHTLKDQIEFELTNIGWKVINFNTPPNDNPKTTITLKNNSNF